MPQGKFQLILRTGVQFSVRTRSVAPAVDLHVVAHVGPLTFILTGENCYMMLHTQIKCKANSVALVGL